MSKQDRNHGRRYGRVMNVRNSGGNVRVDARLLDSHGKIEENMLVQTAAPGMVVVPKVGWIVSIDTDSDGDKMVTGVACGPEVIDKNSVRNAFQNTLPDEEERFQIADDLEPGTIVIQLDRQSGLVYKWNDTKNTFDLTISAGGDIDLEAGGDITHREGVSSPTNEDGLTN